MDESTFEEIISILAKNGRPDLIAELKVFERKIVDVTYNPSIDAMKEKRKKKEIYSEDEGSATSEDELDYIIDEEGFYSLK